MKRQYEFNVKERPLNKEEKEILEAFEINRGIELSVYSVSYERHAPRATVCFIRTNKGFLGLFEDWLYGVTIRSRNDAEVPETGRLTAFRRALNDYADKLQRK